MVTKRDVDQFYGKLKIGSVLRCVKNTYRSSAVGDELTVDKIGASYLHGKDQRGQVCRIGRPTRVGDVIFVTGSVIEYRFGLNGDTAMWEIVRC